MSEQEFNKIFSRNLVSQLAKHNKSQADLAKYLDVSTASVSNWCKGIKIPRMDKVDKMCVFFRCRRSDLMRDEDETQEDEPYYYRDPDARDMAEFLFVNPDYKVLFDASRNVKPEDILFVKEMIDRMSGKSDS